MFSMGEDGIIIKLTKQCGPGKLVNVITTKQCGPSPVKDMVQAAVVVGGLAYAGSQIMKAFPEFFSKPLYQHFIPNWRQVIATGSSIMKRPTTELPIPDDVMNLAAVGLGLAATNQVIKISAEALRESQREAARVKKLQEQEEEREMQEIRLQVQREKMVVRNAYMNNVRKDFPMPKINII